MTATVRGPRKEFENDLGKNVVISTVPAELSIVNFNDGHGKNETKLLLRFKSGDDDMLFFFPKGFDISMQVPSDWIKDQILGKPKPEPKKLPKPASVNVMRKR